MCLSLLFDASIEPPKNQVLSVTYRHYSSGSTPFGEIAATISQSYNRLNSGSGFSVRLQVGKGRGRECAWRSSEYLHAKSPANRPDGHYGSRGHLSSHVLAEGGIGFPTQCHCPNYQSVRPQGL